MNKLRELIAEFEKRKFDLGLGWRERAIHLDNLEDYLMDHAEHIAALIDAAELCNVSAGAGTITDISVMRDALSKLKDN